MYFGAMTSKSFLTSVLRFESDEITSRRVAISPRLALVTSFSMKGRISLALGRVVFIFSRIIKLSAKELIKAFLTFLTLPNFLLLLPCRIPLKILINNLYLFVPFVEFLTGQVLFF